MQEGHSYRLAVDPDSGAHGYEVGFWDHGANLNDPEHFTVVARCFGQDEAAQLVANLNAKAGEPPVEPPVEPEPEPESEPEMHPPARARHRK